MRAQHGYVNPLMMVCTRRLKRKLNFIFFFIIFLIMIYFIYQKDKVTGQEEESHYIIDNYLKKQQMELDDLKKDYQAVIEKQKKEYEERIGNLQQRFIRQQKAPSVSLVIDTGFPADNKKNRLYDMAVTDDKKVWMVGNSRELKLFDLHGNLHRTEIISGFGIYFICINNKQVVFTNYYNKTVRKISDDDNEVTMFTTGDWIPFGITGSASGDLLVCLNKDVQHKVVRYSKTGTVLQEIQSDLQGKPLYQEAFYITENVNGDIIVIDRAENKVITVDKLGSFRYSYSREKKSFHPIGVVTDSVGHVLVADFWGHKIHMLDMDGQFMRYIIPEEGIKSPRALAMINDNEMIVGECFTGLAKKIIL